MTSVFELAPRSTTEEVSRNSIVRTRSGAVQRVGLFFEVAPSGADMAYTLKSVSRSTRLLEVPLIFLVLWANFSAVQSIGGGSPRVQS